MGRLWRNREYRRTAAACGLAALLMLPPCFLLHPLAGALAAALFFFAVAAFSALTLGRYRALAGFSNRLARIAAGVYRLDMGEYAEGELSVLASELLKVTATLAHQAQALERDKGYLADSLADISHQLKTPLTSLSVMMDLLAEPGLEEARRREFLAGARTSLERMQWLISALLKLSRLDAGAVEFNLEEVELEALVRDTAKPLLVPLELRELRLEVGGARDLRVTADRLWLGEALGNLLKNCVEHTPPGGRIQVDCQQTPLYTALTVSDDGPGIHPEDLPQLFQRFYRGKNAGTDSVGIGLALSKAIAGRMGGTLTAENLPQGGCAFTLKLYKGAV